MNIRSIGRSVPDFLFSHRPTLSILLPLSFSLFENFGLPHSIQILHQYRFQVFQFIDFAAALRIIHKHNPPHIASQKFAFVDEIVCKPSIFPFFFVCSIAGKLFNSSICTGMIFLQLHANMRASLATWLLPSGALCSRFFRNITSLLSAFLALSTLQFHKPVRRFALRICGYFFKRCSLYFVMKPTKEFSILWSTENLLQSILWIYKVQKCLISRAFVPPFKAIFVLFSFCTHNGKISDRKWEIRDNITDS